MSDSQLVHPPASSPHLKVEQLAYLDSYDAVIDRDYALVVYTETKAGAQKPVIKIKSLTTPGSSFDAENASFRKALRAAGAHGKEFIHWGFRFQSSETDPRVVENRVYCDEDGTPLALEVHLVTRKADGSAGKAKSVRIDWPG